jgi:hypothetical protein
MEARLSVARAVVFATGVDWRRRQYAMAAERSGAGSRRLFRLETSPQGVFCAGDIRHNSIST